VTVPKTPVNKNGHLEARDDYVRRSRQVSIMSPETNFGLQEEFLNEPFGERIRPVHLAHQPTAPSL
jgi:hypothetical protein